MKFITKIILASSLLPLALATAGEIPPSEGRHLFILAGQSNMRKPLPGAFKAVVEKVFGKDRVIVVQKGHPSQPIRGWYKKWHLPEGQEPEPTKGKAPPPYGNLYDPLMQKVKRAVGDKQISTVSYIWMQGEADAGKGWGKVYEKAFYGVLDQIKTDLKVKQVNYVLGRINDYWINANGFVDGDMLRSLQQKIGEAHEYGDWVNTDDLNTGVNPWGIYMLCDGHFPNTSYEVLGERFARKACLLLNPDLKFGDDVFTAAHFIAPEEIASHAAIGNTVTGSKPLKGKLSKLTDGKFGKPDPKDPAWLHFTPTDGKMTELVLDIGEGHAIDSLGISLLHHRESGAPYPKRMIMEISSDGQKWQSLNRRNISFKYGKSKATSKVESGPRSIIAIVPSKQNETNLTRYLRIKIEAPEVFVDELIVNPVATK